MATRRVLVLEGGGMRGAFQGGACAALEEMDIAFDCIIVVSVGICSGMYLSAGHARDGLRIWTRLVGGEQFITRGPLGFPRMNLDYLLSCFWERVPLNLSGVGTHGSLRAVLTDLMRGTLLYLPVEPATIREVVPACIAIPPWLPVQTLHGRRVADGGLCTSLPVQYALQSGAADITVVTTHPRGWRMPPWKPLLAALVAPWGYPRAQLAHARRARNHNEALRILEQPPRGITIRALYPPADPSMGRFTTDPAVIHSWALAGWAEAHHAFGKTAPSPLRYF